MNRIKLSKFDILVKILFLLMLFILLYQGAQAEESSNSVYWSDNFSQISYDTPTTDYNISQQRYENATNYNYDLAPNVEYYDPVTPSTYQTSSYNTYDTSAYDTSYDYQDNYISYDSSTYDTSYDSYDPYASYNTSSYTTSSDYSQPYTDYDTSTYIAADYSQYYDDYNPQEADSTITLPIPNQSATMTSSYIPSFNSEPITYTETFKPGVSSIISVDGIPINTITPNDNNKLTITESIPGSKPVITSIPISSNSAIMTHSYTPSEGYNPNAPHTETFKSGTFESIITVDGTPVYNITSGDLNQMTITETGKANFITPGFESFNPDAFNLDYITPNPGPGQK